MAASSTCGVTSPIVLATTLTSTPERGDVRPARFATAATRARKLLEQIGGELRNMSLLTRSSSSNVTRRFHRTYPFEDELGEVNGRGGTDLRPPFERAVLAKIRRDVVVYFTDGEGPAHKAAPRVPVLWCLGPGGIAPAKWGRTVWMT